MDEVDRSRDPRSCDLGITVVMQKVNSDDKYYAISDCLILYDYRLKALYVLFYLHKNSSGFFFVFEQLHNLEII